MELRLSSEAANCAVTQELPNILWNSKVNYRVPTGPYPEADQSSLYHPILSLRSILIFTANILHAFLFSPICDTCSAHLILLDLDHCN
jgi:hypothetical protein